MSGAHTPGPWTNHGRQLGAGGLPHSAVAAKTLIARVYSEAYGDAEQEVANAALIAAAPTMLAALQDAETALARCEFAGAKAMDGGMGAIDSALVNIRAAIKKATAP